MFIKCKQKGEEFLINLDNVEAITATNDGRDTLFMLNTSTTITVDDMYQDIKTRIACSRADAKIV